MSFVYKVDALLGTLRKVHLRVFSSVQSSSVTSNVYTWQQQDEFSLSSSVYLSNLVEPKYNYWILIIARPRLKLQMDSVDGSLFDCIRKVSGFILRAARTGIT